jgi:PPE-repeat protein
MKKQKEVGYKGFNVDENNRLYCNPNGIPYYFEVGKTYEIIGQLKMCNNGFHYCRKLNDIDEHYNLKTSVICEIQILGSNIHDINGKKSCASKIKILRILTKEQVWTISNTGKDNTGFINSGNYNSGNRNSGDYNSGNCNSGYYNSGNRNSGDYNSGNCNSGYYNSGNRNSGDRNSGNYNSGDYNSGNYNSGNYNSGNRNSGNYNSGYYNSGDYNSGNCNSGNCNSGDYNSGNYNSGYYNSGNYNSSNYNSGDYNSGNCNSGNYNSGDYNSGNYNSGVYSNGFFNTKQHKIFIFDMPTKMTTSEFKNSTYFDALTSEDLILTEWINYTEKEKAKDKAKELIGGYLKKYEYKEACQIWWNKLTKTNKQIIQSIPNFNKDIFFEITGIKL